MATAAALLKSSAAHIIAKLILADMLGTDDTTVTRLTPRVSLDQQGDLGYARVTIA